MRTHHRAFAPAVRSAFTLIELLVVIAIVSLLVSLLLPALGRSRLAARGVVCLASLRSIGQSVALYCDANKERYPISSHTAGSLVRSDAWLVALQEYGVEPRARKCPMDPFRAQRLTSYATNEHFEPLTPGIDYNPITRKPLPGGRARAFDRLSLLPRPALTIYVYEPEGEGTTDHLSTHGFANADQVRAAIAVTRHLGSGHYLYADGTAKAVSWAFLSRFFSTSTSPFDPETAR